MQLINNNIVAVVLNLSALSCAVRCVEHVCGFLSTKIFRLDWHSRQVQLFSVDVVTVTRLNSNGNDV